MSFKLAVTLLNGEYIMFNKPNYFPMPNEIIDQTIKSLTGSEFKILSIITRNTLGWHKQFDYISTSQFMGLACLSNRQVIDSIRNLEKNGFIKIIFKCHKCNILYNEVTKPFLCSTCGNKEEPDKLYGLNINWTNENADFFLDTKQHPVKKVHNPYEESSQGPMKKVHTQKTFLKTDLKTSCSYDLNKCTYDSESENEKNDDVLKISQFSDLSQEEQKLMIRMEAYMNAKCLTKWNSGIHCEKYPNRKYRLEIVRCCVGRTPFKFIQDTIDGKLLEVEKESLFDEFVHKSIIQSLETGKDYYGN
jgi:hypothetical protein